MNQIEFVCSKFNSRLVGGEKGILRSLRCLLVLRTACTQLHSLPGVGQRSTGALPFPPFESPHLYAPTKKAPEWVLLLLAERKGFEPLIRFPVYTISNRAPSTNSAISPLVARRKLYNITTIKKMQ